jgi:hypothetical protein
MKLSPVTRLLAAGIALVALMSSEAIAQPEFTPTLTITTTGNTVDIQWTPIAIAPTYELFAGSTPGGSDIVPGITLPASLLPNPPRLVVPNVPTGSYYVRVRAAAGAIKGPFSNEVHVPVGLVPCVPGTAPVLGVTVNGQLANVTWTPVPGTIQYRVQWSRFTGVTELEDSPQTTTAAQMLVPLNGNFFVRVVADTNGCGAATSNEAPFTIAVTKRYLSAGEINGILDQVRHAFPRAYQLAHTHTAERYDFIILACRALYSAGGGTIGCNFRRAVIGDLSMDGLSFENPADGRYYFADVISGAGGPNPVLSYTPPFNSGRVLRDSSGQYAPWGFANPFGVAGRHAPLKTAVNYGPAGGW